MTTGRINYRKKAREELKKCRWGKDLIDAAVWDFIQKHGRLPKESTLGFDKGRNYILTEIKQ